MAPYLRMETEGRFLAFNTMPITPYDRVSMVLTWYMLHADSKCQILHIYALLCSETRQLYQECGIWPPPSDKTMEYILYHYDLAMISAWGRPEVGPMSAQC